MKPIVQLTRFVVRPLNHAASGANSPAPMNIPPVSNAPSGANTPMSRGLSAADVRDHKPFGHDMETGFTTRQNRSVSTGAKPKMDGKKSFLSKMFHLDGKDRHEKEKDHHESSLLNPGSQAARGPSPNAHDESPPAALTDSDHSRPPSRAASLKRRGSNKSSKNELMPPPTDPRAATPPIPPLFRKNSGRSASAPHDPKKPMVSVGGQPMAITKKEEVTGASGNKFTLKDLIGMGDGAPKLSRRPSATGSQKGSEKGSTRGSDHGDNTSTASLLKKYGICDKAAIGKGATAVVRLAHKWDRREEKLYAVKVS